MFLHVFNYIKDDKILENPFLKENNILDFPMHF